MSQFLQLSPQKSKGLSQPIYKNAKKLKADALLIAQINQSYSTATSLMILSSEEIIKAIFVLLHSKGYRVYTMTNARRFFSDHRMRHQVFKFIELLMGSLESFEKYIESSPSRLVQTGNKTVDNLFNGLVDIFHAAGPVLQSTGRIGDLGEFNEYKNKGFYVDYIDGLIVPQECIDKGHFQKTTEIVQRIFRVYKLLNILFHPGAGNHFDPKRIALLNEQLGGLIKEGMIDNAFDFTAL
jgi:AbiV family abortive infection protein